MLLRLYNGYLNNLCGIIIYVTYYGNICKVNKDRKGAVSELKLRWLLFYAKKEPAQNFHLILEQLMHINSRV